MSNFGQIKKLCAHFLENSCSSFKMGHPYYNQGPTGLEAIGGPGGASQPL